MLIYYNGDEDKKIKIILAIIAFLLIFGLVNKCHAIFGIDALQKTVNETNNNTENIATQNKKIFEDIATVKENQVTMKAFSDFKNEMKVTLQTELKGMLSGNAGIGNKLEQIDKSIKAGRDVNTNTSIVNDPDVWKGFSGILSTIIMFLLYDASSNRKRGDKYKEKWLDMLMKEKGIDGVPNGNGNPAKLA